VQRLFIFRLHVIYIITIGHFNRFKLFQHFVFIIQGLKIPFFIIISKEFSDF
jgi:hypothetical protein